MELKRYLVVYKVYKRALYCKERICSLLTVEDLGTNDQALPEEYIADKMIARGANFYENLDCR